MTKVLRIALNDPQLDTTIKDTCDVQKGAGYALVAAFRVEADLVLIFQKP